MNRIRTRFAPSPTGFLHVGGLRTALYAYLFAKQNDGDFILRIEDTDLERYVPGAIEVIYKTLEEANILLDEGPGVGGEYGPYIQTERKDIYIKYALKAVEKGAAYYCFCDKERLESIKDENGIKRYDKHCLHLTKAEIAEKLKNNEKFVIRQNMPTVGISVYDDVVYGEIAVQNEELEDQVLIKSDGLPTYNFANVIDDHLMAISHVIRGNEYLSSTPKYNHLYEAFGWEKPKYIHVSTIMKDETRKLSKRYGDANFDDFISKGFLPEAIINYIALLGWSPKSTKEKFSMEELITNFNLSGLTKSNVIFDENKLRWLNSEYIKELPLEKFMEKAKPYFDSSKIKGLYCYEKFGKLLQSRIEVFSEIPDKVNFIVDFNKVDSDLYTNKKFAIDGDVAKAIIKNSIDALISLSEWSEDGLHNIIVKVSEKMNIKSGAVYTVLRIALTGTSVTPGGSVEMADILGKDESLRRLDLALSWLN